MLINDVYFGRREEILEKRQQIKKPNITKKKN